MLALVTLLLIIPFHAATLHGGLSVSSREEDSHGNYAFNYDITDPLGAKNGRYEEGDEFGNKRGYYHLTDIDGRSRRVDYVADDHGFRTFIHTNEPGTATSEPAGAVIKSTQDANIHPIKAPAFVAPPYKAVSTLYTTDLLPQSQPKIVRYAAPITPVRHLSVMHHAPIVRSNIIPVARSPVPMPVVTSTRIVPANHGPYLSHHTRIVPAAPLEYSVSPLSYGSRFHDGLSFYSAPVMSRSFSHHGYLPIR